MTTSPRQYGIYPRREWLADRAVHFLGLVAGLAATPLILLRAAPSAAILPALAYAIGLVAMLACSAAYNLAGEEAPHRALMRRLDRAAIFLMIGGTCGAFTALHLAPGWAEGGVAAIWIIAIAGMVPALAFERRFERSQLVLCLLLGWGTLALVSLAPAVAAFSSSALWLLLAGGLLYSAGVLVHLAHRLPFQNALWHAMVLLAAATHFAAVWRMLDTGH